MSVGQIREVDELKQGFIERKRGLRGKILGERLRYLGQQENCEMR